MVHLRLELNRTPRHQRVMVRIIGRTAPIVMLSWPDIFARSIFVRWWMTNCVDLGTKNRLSSIFFVWIQI